jgi:hypothetical protein
MTQFKALLTAEQQKIDEILRHMRSAAMACLGD